MKVDDIQPKLDATDRVMKYSDMVNFEIKYPADFKKPKYFKDGDKIELHRLQAEDWEARKLGKIVK